MQTPSRSSKTISVHAQISTETATLARLDNLQPYSTQPHSYHSHRVILPSRHMTAACTHRGSLQAASCLGAYAVAVCGGSSREARKGRDPSRTMLKKRCVERRETHKMRPSAGPDVGGSRSSTRSRKGASEAGRETKPGTSGAHLAASRLGRCARTCRRDADSPPRSRRCQGCRRA